MRPADEAVTFATSLDHAALSASCVSILLTVMREQLYCFISSCSTGILCPGCHAPGQDQPLNVVENALMQ